VAHGTHLPGRAAVTGQVRAARLGVTAVFTCNGFVVASWFARVPAVRDALALSAGRLGLLLPAMSAGAALALSTAAAVERRLGHSIMPRFHAAWSLGTPAAAGCAAAAAHGGVPVVGHLTLVAVVVVAGTVRGCRAFLSQAGGATRPTGRPLAGDPPGGTASGGTAGSGTAGSGTAGGGGPAAWREPRTLLVGLLMLVVAFTEGVANDWMAVAFVDGHAVSEAAGQPCSGSSSPR
jgi:hypothetical protein